MKLQRKEISEAEVKLTILQAIDSLSPVTNSQLIRFVGEMDLMDYFSLQINLSDLLQ